MATRGLIEGNPVLEGDPGTEISAELGVRPDDYVIRKRRYSCLDAHDASPRAMEYLQTGARCTVKDVLETFGEPSR